MWYAVCYLLFQSLVNSPEAKANLPNYLAELKENTRKEQNIINNSPANLGAIVTILDMISSIPADAEELIIQVRFYFKSYLFLQSPLAHFVTGDDVLPEELPQLLSVRNRKVLREQR